MANIQPFEYQKRTNIEEHNQLVDKVNEIVGVINDVNLDTINSEIETLKSKATATDTEIANIKDKDSVQDSEITNIKDKDAMQDTEISNIKDKDAMQDTEISNIKDKDAMQDTEISNIKDKDAMQDTEIQDIKKSLVSDVVLMNGTTTGNMKARIERKDAPSIDSNDYNIQKPVSVELVQGSASAMVKAKITLSDGTVLISDDFMFTTESIGTDVYISSFTFKNGNVAGTISADIGLSNGSTLTANNFVVPTDPNVISTISDLQSRMTAVESSTGDITELKTTVDGHTTSINELNTDVTNLTTNKADVNNGNQTITASTINANNINKGGVAVATVNDIPDISGKVNIAQGVGNAGKVLGVGSDGNVTPVDVSAGGEVWEEVDLNNFPTDWVVGDRIKISFKAYLQSSSTAIEHNSNIKSPFIELEVYGSDSLIIFPFYWNWYDSYIYLNTFYRVELLNNTTNNYILSLVAYKNASTDNKTFTLDITRTNIATYVNKIYRLKK